MKVFIRHARGKSKNCSSGMRRWCEKHGFDYNDLVFHGLDAEELRKLGDAQADEAIRMAQLEEAENGR